MSNFWLLSVGIVGLLLYLTWLVPKLTSRPPGPPSWPIVGSLFYLGKLPHRSMEELAKEYGPIMYLRLGSFDHVVISNAEMAMEVLKIHDVDFASRPRMLAGKYASLDWSDIFFSPYGDHWRKLRKICVTQLLTQARLNSFELERQDEVAYMVESIAKHGQRGKLLEMRPIFLQLTSNNMCRMLFGTCRERSNDILGNSFDEFFNSTSNMIDLLTKFNISDLIQVLKPFDLQGIEKQMKRARNGVERQILNILKKYRKGNTMVTDNTRKYFVEILLSLDERLDEKSIMAILMDILGGGTDTFALTLEWALNELIHHPEIMKKAQQKLDIVVGRNKHIFESDIPNLPYLHAIIKENFRLHPIGVTTIPHFNNKDIQMQNYKIFANTTVLVDIWALGRDPKVWEKPQEFNPGRFFGSNVNVKRSNYNLLPFGSGQRQCPSLDLAQLMVQYGLAIALHAFDWFPQLGVNPNEMNMMEVYKGTCPRAESLVVVAKPRLPLQLYKKMI